LPLETATHIYQELQGAATSSWNSCQARQRPCTDDDEGHGTDRAWEVLATHDGLDDVVRLADELKANEPAALSRGTPPAMKPGRRTGPL
jgi:phage/plasmid primase-like uncharacterized protein